MHGWAYHSWQVEREVDVDVTIVHDHYQSISPTSTREGAESPAIFNTHSYA